MTDLCLIGDVQAITQTIYSGSTKPTSTQVSAWITEISAWMSEWTGKKYAETTVTGEKHDGNGTSYFMTDYYPITSVTSLVVDTETLVENTGFWISDAKAGLIECLSQPEEKAEGFSDGHANITIAYKYGVVSIPQAVKELTAIIAAMKCITAATLASTSQGTIKSYSDGDISLQYSDGNTQAEALIKRYEETKLIVPRKTTMVTT